MGVGEGGEEREEGLVCERGGILVSVHAHEFVICTGAYWARLEVSFGFLGLNPSPLSGR